MSHNQRHLTLVSVGLASHNYAAGRHRKSESHSMLVLKYYDEAGSKPAHQLYTKGDT